MKRLLAWCDDRLHPIVLKELRQAAQGRFLSGVLITLVLVQLGSVALFFTNGGLDNATSLSGGGSGEDVFRVLLVILYVLGGLCLPIYAAARFVGERNSEGLALMFISNLSPRRVIVGKMVSNLVLAGLMVSLCLPFMAFTYFLRGIDLPTMAYALVVIGFSMLASIVLAIFVAAIPAQRWMRILVLACGLIALLWWFILSLVASMLVVDRGTLREEFGDDLEIVLLIVLACVTLRLLFLLSVAMVSPQVSNRARPTRRFLSLLWLLGGIGTWWIWTSTGIDAPLVSWFVLSLMCFCGGMLIATSAPDHISGRMREEMPRGKVRRWLEFLWASGAANGFLWSLVGVGASIGWLVVGGLAFDPGGQNTLFQGGGFAAYCAAYCLLGVRLQRGPLAGRVRRSQTWVLVLAAVGFGSLVPPIFFLPFSFGAANRAFEDGYWLLLNPFAVDHHVVGPIVTALGILLALLMVTLQYGWFRRQIVDFFRPADAVDGVGSSPAGDAP